jgi:hypothetical protein
MAHCLENKTITSVDLAEDKHAIRFNILEGESIVAKTDGDCCSYTWIEHVELPAKGFPAKVLSVEALDLPGSVDNSEDYECLQVYGLKIITESGDFVIDYRNSSNGYYGGNLSWPDDKYYYGGVHGQNVSDEIYHPLTRDI